MRLSAGYAARWPFLIYTLALTLSFASDLLGSLAARTEGLTLRILAPSSLPSYVSSDWFGSKFWVQSNEDS
jgi:hypothetical protein